MENKGGRATGYLCLRAFGLPIIPQDAGLLSCTGYNVRFVSQASKNSQILFIIVIIHVAPEIRSHHTQHLVLFFLTLNSSSVCLHVIAHLPLCTVNFPPTSPDDAPDQF